MSSDETFKRPLSDFERQGQESDAALKAMKAANEKAYFKELDARYTAEMAKIEAERAAVKAEPGPRFKPRGSTVILRPVRPEVKEQTEGGLYLPSQVVEAEKAKPVSAISLYDIIAVGPLVDDLAPGQRVWVRSYVVDSFDQEASIVAVEAKDIWSPVEGV